MSVILAGKTEKTVEDLQSEVTAKNDSLLECRVAVDAVANVIADLQAVLAKLDTVIGDAQRALAKVN